MALNKLRSQSNIARQVDANLKQLEKLYILANFLTFRGFQPITIVCIDPRTKNLFILAGENDEIEI